MGKAHSILKSQKGMATFMVTTVLILVIGLVIIGFSQVSRRNQRETLDRQLSTQAFYAAESGVNAAVSLAQEYIKRGDIPPQKDNCTNNAEYPISPNIDGNNVQITCLLVDSSIDDLQYTGVTERDLTVVPVVATDPSDRISYITFTWRPANNASATPSQNCNGGNFPTRWGYSCGHGVLRSDVSPMPNGDADETATSVFFNPRRVSNVSQTSAPSVDFTSRGGLIEGHCSDAGGDPKCMARISGLSGNRYYVNLRSIYKDSNVIVSAQRADGSTVSLTGQALIDVTARAQDVLRRIQVRVPLEMGTASTLPVYAVETRDSICKRYSVFPSYYIADGAVTCN